MHGPSQVRRRSYQAQRPVAPRANSNPFSFAPTRNRINTLRPEFRHMQWTGTQLVPPQNANPDDNSSNPTEEVPDRSTRTRYNLKKVKTLVRIYDLFTVLL